MSKIPKHIYRVARALLFAAIIAVAGLYILIYVLVSMPALQKRLVAMAEKELSALVASKVEIGKLEIYPFNEIRLSDVKIYEPDSAGVKAPCLSVGLVGAGVDLVELFQGHFVFTYAEVTSLNARITRAGPDTPYNIEFLIDAFKPKEQKESSNLNFKIRTVVIRRLSASYDLLWKPRRQSGFDPSHLQLDNFRADISISSLNTKPFAIDTKVRRIAFTLNQLLKVEDIAFTGSFSHKGLELKDFQLKLPASSLALDDLKLSYDSIAGLSESIKHTGHPVALRGSVTPSDLELFLSALAKFDEPWDLDLSGDFCLDSFKALNLSLKNEFPGCAVKLKGDLFSFTHPADLHGVLDVDQLSVAPETGALILSLLNLKEEKARKILSLIGDPALDVKGNIVREVGGQILANLSGDVMTQAGNLSLDVEGGLKNLNSASIKGSLETDRLPLGNLTGFNTIGEASLSADFDLALAGKDISGEVTAELPFVETTAGMIENVELNLAKRGKEIGLKLSADGAPLDIEGEGALELNGTGSQLLASVDLRSVSSTLLGLKGKLSGSSLHGDLTVETTGNSIDNLFGNVTLSGVGVMLNDGKELTLDRLILTSEVGDDGTRDIQLASDYVDATISGHFTPSHLASEFSRMFADLLPAVNPLASKKTINFAGSHQGNLSLGMTIHPLEDLADFFNLPVRPLTDASLSAKADFTAGSADISFKAPYLQQGQSKLLRDTYLQANMTAPGRMVADISTIMPVKNSEMLVETHTDIFGNSADIRADFNSDREAPFSGFFNLLAKVDNVLTPEVSINLKPSQFQINGGEWTVADGDILFHDKRLSASNIRVAHGDQFIEIDGVASASPEDVLSVRLADIDLSYVFDVLNIEYVNFGGFATGDVLASQLFTKTPKLRTSGLKARNFTYGGAVLGAADLSGIFHAPEQRIQIGAHIVDPRQNNERRADVDGSIWLKRDSLSFNFDANRINASFLGQFMSAFASDLSATASGDCHLFGTFKDIDLTGRLHADSIRFKLDFTGVYYSGSDSVFLESGRIHIPSFRIYDRDGNKGVFSGELKHKFLRDVNFDFRLRDAKNLLCYDLPKGQDDFWWGTVYASGNASIHGVPGMTDINLDVTTDGGSSFYFALSDTEAAQEYNFLTFTDKTPKPDLPKKKETPDFVEMFRKKKKIEEDGAPSDVHIDLRLNATPGVAVTLVMDPVAGDKITGRGYGPLQLQYETENDEPRLYGKFTLVEGVYNFSLQDVILRDFQIKDGSSITFNGDPLAAILDIKAAYRVNTSLTDLDKSFAFDRDLNRTNVPVDAMLLVKGPMDAPDIDFDIELPTLTEETTRKVRSIISTNDLMSRQIIYLLALNKFYTPEYMDTSGSGGEWTSVASSTISSQLGNALSQLTDKLSVMPSFRSDKGDFSDLEMDVALSSRLLNNRLLINGNFGYRDRTTSTTTFVGDFDVQYLLNRKGTFRLKAYNHFNDQNYYLRQALTTQGIGVEFLHDFNRFLSFLRPKKAKTVADSVRAVTSTEGRREETELNITNDGTTE